MNMPYCGMVRILLRKIPLNIQREMAKLPAASVDIVADRMRLWVAVLVGMVGGVTAGLATLAGMIGLPLPVIGTILALPVIALPWGLAWLGLTALTQKHRDHLMASIDANRSLRWFDNSPMRWKLELFHAWGRVASVSEIELAMMDKTVAQIAPSGHTGRLIARL
jgi:hypothetical protein